MLGDLDLTQRDRIVLASQSPRRTQILDLAHIPHVVDVSRYEETHDPSHYKTPQEYVLEQASGKAHEVADRLRANGTSFWVVIGCDTIVCDKDSCRIFEKPASKKEATTMLTNYSGKSHTVISGVCLVFFSGAEDCFVEETKVEFSELTDSLIAAYVATGDWKDKAGGYGIQSDAAPLIRRIEGCYYNIMGLPLNSLTRKLREAYLGNR